MFAAMRTPAARRFAGPILLPMMRGSLIFTLVPAPGEIPTR
jgi:hypothetical protein